MIDACDEIIDIFKWDANVFCQDTRNPKNPRTFLITLPRQVAREYEPRLWSTRISDEIHQTERSSRFEVDK